MFYQNKAFVVAVVICCPHKTVVTAARYVKNVKMAMYNAKSSTRSILASTTPICMYFPSNGTLSELSFRNFPNEHNARVHVSFQRISLNFAFNFLETISYTKKSEVFLKADFYVEVSRRSMARISFGSQ